MNIKNKVWWLVLVLVVPMAVAFGSELHYVTEDVDIATNPSMKKWNAAGHAWQFHQGWKTQGGTNTYTLSSDVAIAVDTLSILTGNDRTLLFDFAKGGNHTLRLGTDGISYSQRTDNYTDHAIFYPGCQGYIIYRGGIWDFTSATGYIKILGRWTTSVGEENDSNLHVTFDGAIFHCDESNRHAQLFVGNNNSDIKFTNRSALDVEGAVYALGERKNAQGQLISTNNSVRLVGQSKINCGTFYHNNAIDLSIDGGSEINCSDYQIGNFYSNSVSGNASRLYVGDNSLLSLSGQFMQSGTNSTVIIDNGTLRSSHTQYSFYYGFSRDNETVFPVCGNKFVFRGDHPKLEMTGSAGSVYFANDTVVRFELPASGVYTSTPITANTITLAKTVKVEISGVEAIREQLTEPLQITLMESVSASGIDFAMTSRQVTTEGLPSGVSLVVTGSSVAIKISPPSMDNKVAIDGVRYDSLSQALAAVKAGDTIKLLGNCVYTGTLSVSSKPKFTLDLNGFNFTVDGTFVNGNSASPCTDPAKAKTFIVPEGSTWTINGQFMLTGEGHTMDLAGTIIAQSTSGYSFYWGYVANDNTNALGQVIYAGVPNSNTFIFRGNRPKIVTPNSTDCWIMYSKVIYDLDGKGIYDNLPMQSSTRTCGLAEGCSAEFRGLEAIQDILTLSVVFRLVEGGTVNYARFRPVNDGSVTIPDGCQVLQSLDKMHWELHVGPRFKNRNYTNSSYKMGDWDFKPHYGDGLVIGDNTLFHLTGQYMATGTNLVLVVSNGTMQVDSQYSFYFGHYCSNNVEQSSNCSLIFRGRTPRINCIASNSQLSIRQTKVVFDLPPEGYDNPPLKSGATMSIVPATVKFVFEGVERIKEYYRGIGGKKDILLMQSGSAIGMPSEITGLPDDCSLWQTEDRTKTYLRVAIPNSTKLIFK